MRVRRTTRNLSQIYQNTKHSRVDVFLGFAPATTALPGPDLSPSALALSRQPSGRDGIQACERRVVLLPLTVLVTVGRVVLVRTVLVLVKVVVVVRVRVIVVVCR